MKKIMAVLALLIVGFGFVACNESTTTVETTQATTTASNTTTTDDNTAQTTTAVTTAVTTTDGTNTETTTASITTTEGTNTETTTEAITTTEGTNTETTTEALTTTEGTNTETTTATTTDVVTTTSILEETTYTFEAEYVNLDGKIGAGYSGGTFGTGLICFEDVYINDAEASNGAFLSYLYSPGMTITFDFTSDRAVENATLVFRVSAEVSSFTITNQMMLITINDIPIDFADIVFANVPSMFSGEVLPFFNVEIGQIPLLQGANKVEMIIDNDISLGGTMGATAPMLDCIYITTSAVLTWVPREDNLAF